MQQAIQYFTLRKYRSMLELKNTTLKFLPLTGILTLIFKTLLYYFWIRKPFFSALSFHELKNKQHKNLALKRCMKTFKTKLSLFSGIGTLLV